MKMVEAESVAGERGVPGASSYPSPHAKVSNILALGLMLAMGAGLLVTYYMHTAQRAGQTQQQKARAGAMARAQSELRLPALGAIATPWEGAQVPSAPMGVAAISTVPLPAAPIAGPPPVPHPSSLDRRLSGAAYAPTGGEGPAGSHIAAGAADAVTGVSSAGTPASGSYASGSSGSGAMASLLHEEPASMVAAHLLPAQQLLLPRGAFIDCTLETAIDSSLPGLTSCVTATDTFGVDGRVVLLERGTKLVGETRGQVQQGMARVFVLWTQARTPSGVIVPLDSPSADALGRSGLSGVVERHFWERFGAALLVSGVDGAVQAAVQSSNRGSGTFVYNPSSAQDVGTEVLKSTLNIAPTVRVDNGARIQILVARDIDFTGVFELRHAAATH